MEQNKFISVEYQLYTENGEKKELREQTGEGRPFTFISGMGYTLEAFENNIVPLAAGDEFDFTLSPEEAYGEIEKERILELDRSIFQINGHFDNEHIFEGADVPMQNEEGMRLYGHVVKISDDKVIMDFNHPLAGEAIQYKGKVVENRDATAEEIQHFINFLSGGCGGCGGGCDHDHCGGDCEHDHCDCDHDHDHDHCGCGHCH